jgi:hypothetical protein
MHLGGLLTCGLQPLFTEVEYDNALDRVLNWLE